MDKNIISEAQFNSSELLASLVASGDTSLVEKDSQGGYHFNGGFNNVDSAKAVLNSLKENKQYYFFPLCQTQWTKGTKQSFWLSINQLVSQCLLLCQRVNFNNNKHNHLTSYQKNNKIKIKSFINSITISFF